MKFAETGRGSQAGSSKETVTEVFNSDTEVPTIQFTRKSKAYYCYITGCYFDFPERLGAKTGGHDTATTDHKTTSSRYRFEPVCCAIALLPKLNKNNSNHHLISSFVFTASSSGVIR